MTQEDLNRTVKACGGTILTTVNDIKPNDMGQCDKFEEVQIGNERYENYNVLRYNVLRM